MYRKMGLIFDLLSNQLAEDNLLGEILASDNDNGMRTVRAGG
jgi:hypothetical protein